MVRIYKIRVNIGIIIKGRVHDGWRERIEKSINFKRRNMMINLICLVRF